MPVFRKKRDEMDTDDVLDEMTTQMEHMNELVMLLREQLPEEMQTPILGEVADDDE